MRKDSLYDDDYDGIINKFVNHNQKRKKSENIFYLRTKALDRSD